MSYVFGDTLICDDAASAKLVTFSPQVGGVKSVTLDGDVYDPSGTLSGGSAPSGSGILVRVQGLKEVEMRLYDAQGRLRKLEDEARGAMGKRDTWRKLKGELEIKEHELGLLEEQVGNSNAARVCFEFSSFCELLCHADILSFITAERGNGYSEANHRRFDGDYRDCKRETKSS